jgi:hypothetical protein
MALGSVVMWIGLPFAWLWLASRISTTTPSVGPYLMVAAGLPVSMALVGFGLGALDRLFIRVTGYDPNARRKPLPWLESMRGDRNGGRRRSALDTIMIVSVAIAGTLFAAWFFFIAGSSLPR